MTESLLLLLAFLGADAELVPLREHLAHGRYVEGAEAWESLAAEVRQTPEGRWLRARFHAAVGEDAAVTELLAKLLEEFPDAAVWWGRAAEHQWNQGLIDQAAESAAKGLTLDPDEPRCRLVQAEVWTARGDLKQALEGYRWFVRYYNRAQPTDAETLLLIGRGAAMYARWKSVSQIFNFIVNTACVDALKADPLCWEAHQLAGALLLEKYNSADGEPELERALAINPHAVDVHVTLAATALDDLRVDDARRHLDRALETHPTHREALRLQARWLLQSGDLPAAERILEQLRQTAPLEQRAVAVEVAVACARQGDPPLDRLGKLLGSFERIASWEPSDAAWERPIVELVKRNPRPGYFLQDFGAFFEQQRKLRYAEVCYQAAIDHMPQLAQPKTELGMLMFQSGRLDEAQRLLDAAFEADPYHVRVSNMRKVLKVLDGYAAITTPHFVIRADSQLDRVLAKYLAEELETVYTRVTEEYGYEPPQRTQIELYNKARGLAGHQWFSARMTGLPWLQTIGASTGLIVALTSPGATDEPYNWARVVQHEFIHVVTLQQTDFNIPHWFTEALATRAEGYPMPKSWNRLLIDRVASGKLRNLDNLHLGFQRAESREDWDFAYCQSVLYADYFLERYGPDALRKLLNAYRTTRSTELALQQAYGARQAEVEAGYLDFLKRRVAALQANPFEDQFDEEAVVAAYEADSEDPAHRADFARLELRKRRFDEAETLAAAVLKDHPKQATAAIVVAQCRLVDKEPDAALEVLTRAYDPQRIEPTLGLLLSQLHRKRDEPEQALAILRQGLQVLPEEVTWLRALAEAAEAAGELELARQTLARVCELDAESLAERRRLAELVLAAGDHAAAVKYARLALHIDVLDAAIHLTLARGYRGLNDLAAAKAEYEVALELQPKSAEIEAELRALSATPPAAP